ncbi:hypothetical protein Mal15_14550 [Stieleria maiorica]|uniref:Uncharacterized protein n=1 Tax=Stieleria maiorica TaxID=2795974 RepID=A0A5B9MD49_9BACT|nr:hypothetical protein Mal15_14550 [Stieleria maiorica]
MVGTGQNDGGKTMGQKEGRIMEGRMMGGRMMGAGAKDASPPMESIAFDSSPKRERVDLLLLLLAPWHS